MNITSQKAIVNAKKEDIIDVLKASENLEKLLPADKISNFKSDDSQCSFKAQGGITITLVQNGTSENELKLKSGAKSPFPFDLTVHLDDHPEGSEGNIVFEGKVNAFLQMMVQKPLSELFEYMTQALKKHYAQ